MCFVYIEPVNAELLEGHNIVLAFGFMQLFKPCQQPLFCAL